METDQLKAAYEAAKKLSLKDQDMIAKQILETIEEMEWDEIVSHPKVMQKICDLADEALEEHLAGKTIKGGFGRD
jgi:hypothetical protein